MTSFFQKARDKAEQAAAGIQAYAQQQQQLHSQSASSSSSDPYTAASVPQSQANAANQSTSSGISSYTGAVPHLLRNSLASYDPRFESTRTFHVLSTSLKNLSIDNEALARESKSAAKATYRWGQDHIPGKREDAVGDAALVDVTDRLAYILSTIGDLHQAHAKRSELARGELKQVRSPEKDLAARRAKRVAIKKELHGLVPERAKKDQTAKIVDLENQLKQLEKEDSADEERVAALKRTALRDGYEGIFDSMIELGEKIALISRYGKLLTHVVPVSESPEFPSKPQLGEPSWSGANRTAEIRSAIEPALKNYQPIVKLADLEESFRPDGSVPPAGHVQESLNSAAGIASGSASRVSTASYGVSHAEELMDEGPVPLPSSSTGNSLNRVDSNQSAHLSPLPEGGSLNPNLNLSPTLLPSSSTPNVGAAPSLPERSPSKHRVPPLPSSNDRIASPLPVNAPQPPTPNPSDLNSPSAILPPTQSVHNLAGAGTSPSGYPTEKSSENPFSNSSSVPDDPTFAETGRPVVGQGGPKTGSLGTPRRPSNTFTSTSTSDPNQAQSLTGSGSGSLSGAAAHSNYQSKAQEAEAEREEVRRIAESNRLSFQNLNVGGQVQARIRRDGTVVRRGEHDFQKAEEENLPVYQEVDGENANATCGNVEDQQTLSEAARAGRESQLSGGKN